MPDERNGLLLERWTAASLQCTVRTILPRTSACKLTIARGLPECVDRAWLHLNLVLRKEEGGCARVPVLHKCAGGHHLIMHSGQSNRSQQIIAQLYQPAAPGPPTQYPVHKKLDSTHAVLSIPDKPSKCHAAAALQATGFGQLVFMKGLSLSNTIQQEMVGHAAAHLKSVWMTEEMMRGPPLAPSAARRRPSAAVTIMGDMELCGFLKGRMKLDLLGGRPYVLAWSSVEKSSIWLFKMMPAGAQQHV